MKSLGEIKKGLEDFIAHWSRIAINEDSGSFGQINDPIKDY